MMRVTIDIVPHGDESAKRTIEVVEVWQVERLDDDPGGVRLYETSDGLTLLHLRDDGARVLAAMALDGIHYDADEADYYGRGMETVKVKGDRL